MKAPVWVNLEANKQMFRFEVEVEQPFFNFFPHVHGQTEP
jgi:hypothetical protein